MLVTRAWIDLDGCPRWDEEWKEKHTCMPVYEVNAPRTQVHKQSDSTTRIQLSQGPWDLGSCRTWCSQDVCANAKHGPARHGTPGLTQGVSRVRVIITARRFSLLPFISSHPIRSPRINSHQFTSLHGTSWHGTARQCCERGKHSQPVA